MAHHVLPQGHEGSRLRKATAEADEEGLGNTGTPCQCGGQTLGIGTDERTAERDDRPVPGSEFTRPRLLKRSQFHRRNLSD